jgi:hypothetical protein
MFYFMNCHVPEYCHVQVVVHVQEKSTNARTALQQARTPMRGRGARQGLARPNTPRVRVHYQSALLPGLSRAARPPTSR